MNKLVYDTPCLNTYTIKVSGVLCDSFVSNSLPNYNKRDDISLEWDED